LLKFSATGGMVIGVGNGNPNSTEPDVASERRAFNGLAQAIIRVGDAAGPIDAAVTSAGLTGSRLRIMALPSVQGRGRA
jgi:beta-galactosidase